MKTIYIKGRDKFKKKIRKGLYKSDLREGQDYIIGEASADFALIWCRDDLTIRELKLAISPKYIWKYRMMFYSSIEEMNPVKEDDTKLTEQELEFIKRVKRNEKIMV